MLTVRNSREGARIIFKILFLSPQRVLLKNQRALSSTENGRKWLLFDSGCSGWQSTPENLVNIDLPNLVGWLQDTLWKEQKLFRVILSNSKASFNKKTSNFIQHKKWAKLTYIWFWVQWLAEHAPKTGKCRFNKFGWLTRRDAKEEAKIFFKIAFLSLRGTLLKTQRTLSNSENDRKWLLFDSGCTG